jgi:hypothetical protein
MEDMMAVPYRLSGKDGVLVDCGSHQKIRVVFGRFDKAETKIAWNVFSSKADAATHSVLRLPGVHSVERIG